MEDQEAVREVIEFRICDLGANAVLPYPKGADRYLIVDTNGTEHAITHDRGHAEAWIERRTQGWVPALKFSADKLPWAQLPVPERGT